VCLCHCYPLSHLHIIADRAKAIKTTAIINESETDKLIRTLREENARLMEMIKNGQVSFNAPVGVSDEGECCVTFALRVSKRS